MWGHSAEDVHLYQGGPLAACGAYNLVRRAEGDEPKTAYTAPTNSIPHHAYQCSLRAVRLGGCAGPRLLVQSR
jgi:hypothetical protein